MILFKSGVIAGKFSCALILFLLFVSTCVFSQSGRIALGLNKGWDFTKESYDPVTNTKVRWEKINLPHTWNDKDVTDDTAGYYRGTGWYRKSLSVDKSFKGKKISVFFEGSNQETEVFINGKNVGNHIGGYTRFSFPVDSYLNFEEGAENTMLVKVNNKHNDNIPPLSADFTFFGGIYRDVNLIVTDPIHFSIQKGAKGVFITTPKVSSSRASVNVKSVIENNTGGTRKLRLFSVIKSAEGKIIGERSTTVSLKSGTTTEVVQAIEDITTPKLWSPEDPYLYTVITRITNTSGELLDEVVSPLGFRWFKFDADKGFYLNDKPYKLIGASRHQDFSGKGNALEDSYHINDVLKLKEMGGNFLRVAHYPQDPTVLEACDRLGVLASVEIPIVNAITETEEFAQNCLNMQTEMIRQNFNHPSVIMWVYMNEVFLRPKFGNQKERQQEYFKNITKLAQRIEDLTRKEDPYRYTMIPNYGYYELHKNYKLIDVPMVVGWNLYQGWYTGSLEDFGRFLDRCHTDYPSKPIMVTEYGADADSRIRSLKPEKFDKSVDYSLNFHEYYLSEMMKRDFVSAALIWNLADFNSEVREETMPHINTKGLLTLDRKPKDLFFFYQSQLLQKPFLKLSNWNDRSGVKDSLTNTSTQSLDVFSNAPQVELVVNGKSLGVKQKVEGRRFSWNVPFVNGINYIEAKALINGKEYRDLSQVSFTIISFENQETQYNQLNVLLGAKRIYTEEETNTIWIPGQEYKKGSWGYIGGVPFKMKGNTRQSYGTDRGIKGTVNDPIYQTQMMGIQKFKLDVPDGEYELVLHFAELMSGETKEALAYNLDNSDRKDKAETRVFDVLVNDRVIFNRLNIRKNYGALRAGVEKIRITVDNGKGIDISFTPIVGTPVLNALQLRKIY